MFLNHYPVFYREILELFKDKNTSEYLFADLTFGGGGHSLKILSECPKSKLIGFDQDPDAIENGHKLIEENGLRERLFLVNSNFENLKSEFLKLNLGKNGLDGIIVDLGVSSHQLDLATRGFSFRNDGPLDMRMDQDKDAISAKDVVNTYDEEDIANIIYKYGEERLSRKIASNIVSARKEKSIETTKELEEIVFLSYPKKFRHGRTHPATKTFQALRIFVNRELEVIENVIPDALELLAPGGFFAAITFHSLEDRIVKHSFKDFAKTNDNYQLLSKKPILPSEEEILENSRSRSAKLRVIKRI